MSAFRSLFAILGLVPAAILFSVDNSFAEMRVALVIGNGAYQNAPRLRNPAHDANDVAAALKRSGFQTILATDLNRDGMQDVAVRFARAARTADVAMVYYSGHALQFGGVNYLAPIDIRLSDEADLRRMIRVDEIVSDLERAKNLRILVLDACRDNPFADQLKRSVGASRSLPLQRGLAKIDSPQGMIVGYATQAGRTAEDGDGRNSPYTAAFLKNIEAKEEIGTIFRRISADVYRTTKHTQLPELSLSLIGEFYLRGKSEIDARSVTTSIPPDSTKEDFEAAEGVDSVGGWDAFLVQHPAGLYAALARERRDKAAVRLAAPTGTASDHDLTALECITKYQAAKAAGTLDGQTWYDYRRVQCVGDVVASPAVSGSNVSAPTKEAATSPVSDGVVFPEAINPKYATEDAGRARVYTCLDQYNANKATKANGGMKWMELGGGYLRECNKRLSGT